MSGEHRETIARNQDLHAAYVGLVDLVSILVHHALRLRVRALAKPYARSGVSKIAAVGLGAVQVCLQHGPAPVLGYSLRSVRKISRVESWGVILHIEGHGGTSHPGGAGDQLGVLQCELRAIAEVQAQRTYLDRNLGRRAEAGFSELGEEIEIGDHYGVCLCAVGGVLSVEINGGQQPRCNEAARDGYRVLGGLSCDSKRSTTPPVTGAVVTRFLILWLRDTRSRAPRSIRFLPSRRLVSDVHLLPIALTLALSS